MMFKVVGYAGNADIEAPSMKEAAERYVKEHVPLEVWPLNDEDDPIEVHVDGKLFDVFAREETVPKEHLTEEAQKELVGAEVKAAYLRAVARD